MSPQSPATTTLQDAERIAAQRGWIEGAGARALYVSAGDDTRALTLLHPAFLERQGVAEVSAPDFFVFVDRQAPRGADDAALRFDDGRTRVDTDERLELRVADAPAHLLRCTLRSDELGARAVAVLRVRTDNEALCLAALREGWRPDFFIAVNDGCGGFGGNPLCANTADPSRSIPLRLGARWWVTDHFDDLVGAGDDPAADPRDGDRLRLPPSAPTIEVEQRAFLSTLWRSAVSPGKRLRGGARLFSVRPLAPASAGPRSPDEEASAASRPRRRVGPRQRMLRALRQAAESDPGAFKQAAELGLLEDLLDRLVAHRVHIPGLVEHPPGIATQVRREVAQVEDRRDYPGLDPNADPDVRGLIAGLVGPLTDGYVAEREASRAHRKEMQREAARIAGPTRAESLTDDELAEEARAWARAIVADPLGADFDALDPHVARELSQRQDRLRPELKAELEQLLAEFPSFASGPPVRVRCASCGEAVAVEEWTEPPRQCPRCSAALPTIDVDEIRCPGCAHRLLHPREMSRMSCMACNGSMTRCNRCATWLQITPGEGPIGCTACGASNEIRPGTTIWDPEQEAWVPRELLTS